MAGRGGRHGPEQPYEFLLCRSCLLLAMAQRFSKVTSAGLANVCMWGDWGHTLVVHMLCSVDPSSPAPRLQRAAGVAARGLLQLLVLHTDKARRKHTRAGPDRARMRHREYNPPNFTTLLVLRRSRTSWRTCR